MVTSNEHGAVNDAPPKDQPFATIPAEPTDWSALASFDTYDVPPTGTGVAAPCVGVALSLAAAEGDAPGESEEAWEIAVQTLNHEGIRGLDALQLKPDEVSLSEFVTYLTRLKEDDLQEVLETGEMPEGHRVTTHALYAAEAFLVDIILVSWGAEDDVSVEEVLTRMPEGSAPAEFAREYAELTEEERELFTW